VKRKQAKESEKNQVSHTGALLEEWNESQQRVTTIVSPSLRLLLLWQKVGKNAREIFQARGN
jgi:hypothetical protein